MGVRAITAGEHGPRAVPAGGEREDPLVARARSGDWGAFEDLYRKHAGRVYAICLRMTGRRSRAEDLTQEVFIRAWERLDTLRGDGGFAAWLRRVAINRVISEGRAAGRRSWREHDVEEPERWPGPDPTKGAGQALDLERAIAGLPAGARNAFVLHDVEGYKHAEIARMLGIAVGTSKAQLHRARRLLREALGT